MDLPEKLKSRLSELGRCLLDQQSARILVEPLGSSSGYWFGGGNLCLDQEEGVLISGRYRNQGDARSGVDQGERGLECVVFKANSPDCELKRIISFSKKDLSVNEEVISIEGVSLIHSPKRQSQFEFIISTEKKISYPPNLLDFQKPGTGVWSIDSISSESGIESLDHHQIKTIASSEKTSTLHYKDPVAFVWDDGETHILFCHHPFSWSSTNSGLLTRTQNGDSFELMSEDVLGRGNSWDVACSRITERLPVPRIGPFADFPSISLYFYDGAECLRPLRQDSRAAKRPRGYSCEELGGLAWGWDKKFPEMQRISVDFPMFVSPYGTGCCRYASAIFLRDESIFATWQQSQSNNSQPLVANHLPAREVHRILS